jgi:hypothetical protein
MALNILKDKRETIILKEEVKNLMPKQKEGSKKEESDDGTKTFLLQNLKRVPRGAQQSFPYAEEPPPLLTESARILEKRELRNSHEGTVVTEEN